MIHSAANLFGGTAGESRQHAPSSGWCIEQRLALLKE